MYNAIRITLKVQFIMSKGSATLLWLKNLDNYFFKGTVAYILFYSDSSSL